MNWLLAKTDWDKIQTIYLRTVLHLSQTWSLIDQLMEYQSDSQDSGQEVLT